MSTELQEIQDFFKSNNIPLSTEWLQSCIEWCKDGDGNLPPNYTSKDIKKMVYEQWLILDLRDVEIPSLPRNLSNEKKYCLTGSYCLQMMQVVDISKPKLWQLQRIRNNVAKNTEAEKDFGKRVLQLTLTDGVQEVEAMEFQPIQCLNINLSPGTKIRITGPVMIRNGRLMLKEENVKYLGGAVDEIRVQFAAENVLARALRLEENPNPYTIDEKALEVSEANTTTQMDRTASNQNYYATGQNRNQNQSYQAQPRNTFPPNPEITRNNQNFSSSSQTTSRAIVNRHNNQEIPPEFQVDDDLLRELEADFEENSIRNTINVKRSTRTSNTNTNSSNLKTTNKSNRSNRSSECNSPDLFEEMEIDDELLNDHLDQIDVSHMTSNVKSTVSSISRGFSSDITKKLECGVSSSGSAKTYNDVGKLNVGKNPTKVVQDLEISSSGIFKTKRCNSEEVIALDDSFDDIDIDSHLDDIDEEMANLPSSTQNRNDLKNRLRSPELKSRKIISNNPKTLPATESLCLKKPLASSKKLTQGTLNFGSSKNLGLNMPSSLNLNSQDIEDKNPFSIFNKGQQELTGCALNSLNPTRKPSNISHSEFESKFLAGTSATLSTYPQKSSNIVSPDFESKYLPSTSRTSLNSPQNSSLLSLETILSSPPSTSKICNVMSIEKLKKMLPNIGKGKFKIKAKFRRVAEKLQLIEGSYHFVIVVEDSTGHLTVQIHADVVTNITGVKPEELAKLKVLALQQDENVKRQIFMILDNLHQKCLALDDILEIQVTRGEQYPLVINII